MAGLCRHNKRKDELFIFDDQTGKPSAAKNAAAASVSQGEEKVQEGQEMVVFPGVNAPAPPGADTRLWVSMREMLYMVHQQMKHNAIPVLLQLLLQMIPSKAKRLSCMQQSDKALHMAYMQLRLAIMRAIQGMQQHEHLLSQPCCIYDHLC